MIVSLGVICISYDLPHNIPALFKDFSKLIEYPVYIFFRSLYILTSVSINLIPIGCSADKSWDFKRM